MNVDNYDDMLITIYGILGLDILGAHMIIYCSSSGIDIVNDYDNMTSNVPDNPTCTTIGSVDFNGDGYDDSIFKARSVAYEHTLFEDDFSVNCSDYRKN